MSTFRSEQFRQPVNLSGSFTGSLQGTASYALKGVGSLFPSTDFIANSRDFASTDVNKILILPSGSNLTMPSIFPFNDGDIIGIYPLDSGSSFQTAYTGYSIYPYAVDANHQNELVVLSAISQSSVLAPVSTALIGDVGFSKTALRHIVDTLPKYTVYTALLTQTGGSNPAYIYDQSLVIGATYYINNNDGSGDFTNVGAPSNNQGTYFVATGTTPTSWGTLNSVDLYYDSGAPVVTVLENTIGNITWTYNQVGDYSGNLIGAFPENKTFVTLTLGGGVVCILNSQRISDDEVIYSSNNPLDTNPIDVGGMVQMEIRVYN